LKSGIQLRENNYSTQNIFIIFVSFSGLFSLIAMYLWSPQSTTHYSLQKPIILLLFVVISILGMLSAIYPSKCKTLMKFQNDSKKTINDGNVRFEGHHPDCGKFSSHTLNINGKKYCPGCLGLFIGAFIAIVGILIYYFMGYPFIYGEISFWIGLGTVFIVLLLIVFLNLEKKLKFISNMALVIGSFLILLGLDSVKGNLIIGLYFLILVIFWILTRIVVSETSHEIICRDCVKKSICIYE
jgi:hypothetical protein